MKKLVSLFLVAMLCLAVIPMQAFAVGSEHICTYRTWISYDYTPYSNTMHLVKTIKHYECTDPKCPIEYTEVINQHYESHHNAFFLYNLIFHLLLE